MNIEITDKQLDKLSSIIQGLIDSQLNIIREESEEWGLGEIDEYNELSSIDKIIIDRIVPYSKIKVYVDLYRNSDREEFDNIIGELQYMINEWLPKVELYINQIIDTNN
jgi:hypothetical protein